MDLPPDSTQDQPTLHRDIPGLRALADLYVQAKALILYSEEVDPDSRSNRQVIKVLRDALDHLMRVIVARVGTQAPTDAADPEYTSRNIHKAIGHIYRAAFDALDGTVLSLRVRNEGQRALSLGEALFAGRIADLHWVTPDMVLATWEIYRRFADKQWSFTDCLSKVVMERRGIATAFAFDAHFRQFGTVAVVPAP